MLSRTINVTLPFRQYLNNRRSVTCGERSSLLFLPERQYFRTLRLSCLSGSMILQFSCRWSSTIGYENYVLSDCVAMTDCA
jgi:hypothetical protein